MHQRALHTASFEGRSQPWGANLKAAFSRTALAVLAALVLAVLSPRSVADTPPEPLGHAGRWITDATGRVIIPRGVSMVSKFPPYTPAAAGFGEKDALLLEREGFNVVRVGVIYSAVEPFPGHYNEAYLSSIRSTVELLQQHGIMSLIDFHQDGWGPAFHTDGFPIWATITNGFPIFPLTDFPAIYFKNKALQHAFDNFWANTQAVDGIGLQDHFARAWAHTALRLRHTPGILGWELINEPFPGSNWQSVFLPPYDPINDQTVLTPFYERVRRAIRTVDTQHIVWYEPWVSFDEGAKTFVGKLDDPKLGFAFHNYLSPQAVQLPYIRAVERTKDTGDALMATEFGAVTDPSVIARQVANADAFLMPAIYWTYWNRTPYAISGAGVAGGNGANQGIVLSLKAPLVPGNVSEAKLNALVRPYPRAIAGTPIFWSYDPGSRSFGFLYSTQAAQPGRTLAPAAQTEIFVPRRHYPAGYRVMVTGATILSGPGAPLLRLVNHRNAGLVTVHIVPR